MLNMKSVAILLTVHNRKEKTYKCLNSVYKNIGKITEYDFDVYLTDDGSTDGTYTMVKENFSKVKVIKGNGNLFWCRGMYVAWKEACNTKDYDYYIWLNDDVELFDESLENGIKLCNKVNNYAIITGAFRSKKNGDLTYGAKFIDDKKVGPNGKLQEIQIFFGNFIVVPNNVVKKIGIIDPTYKHAYGDNDYSLRALKNNIKVYLMPEYVGYCEAHSYTEKYMDPKQSVKNRFKALYSPVYTPHDAFVYNYRYFSLFKALRIVLQLHIITLFPRLKNKK